MKVKCELDATSITDFISNGKYASGAEQLVVRNGDGYREVRLQIGRFNGAEWENVGEISVNGGDLEKAIHNAMND